MIILGVSIVGLGILSLKLYNQNLAYNDAIKTQIIQTYIINSAEAIDKDNYTDIFKKRDVLTIEELTHLEDYISNIAKGTWQLDYLGKKVYNLSSPEPMNSMRFEPHGIFGNTSDVLQQLILSAQQQGSQEVTLRADQIKYLSKIFEMIDEYNKIDKSVSWVKYLKEVRNITTEYNTKYYIYDYTLKY